MLFILIEYRCFQNHNMAQYVTYAKIKQQYSISPETIRNWAKKGQIRFKTVQNATRKTWLYDINSIGEFIKSSTDATEAASTVQKAYDVVYIRVSSRKQTADLQRQKELLTTAYPDAECISDIGSGLNYKRPGFTKLVRKICRGEISQVVVTFRDRLLRFGYDLFKQLCDEHGTKILVYGFRENSGSDDHSEINTDAELKDDLLAIVNVFVARNNGKRAALLRKQRKLQAAEKTAEKTAEFDDQDKIISDDTPETNIEQDAEC